jgi:raffinose/stachyose/melibiose transport system permease protein
VTIKDMAFNLPLSIFILTEYMRHIPREMTEEAARIDGSGPWQSGNTRVNTR